MADVLIIALAALCTLLPFWIAARQGLLAWVSPLHLLGYFCGLGFLAKALAYAIAPDLAFYASFDPAPGAALAGAIYLGGFVALICAGYLLACKPQQPPAARIMAARGIALGVQPMGALVGLALVVSLVTVLLILRARGLGLGEAGLIAGLNRTKQINVNADGIGATLAGIKTLFVIPKCAFVLCLAQMIVQPTPPRVMMTLALAGALVGIALVSGDRFELVELAIYALATYALLGGRLGWRQGLLGLACAWLIVMLSAYMTELRLGGQGASLLRQIIGSTYFLDINVAVMVTGHVETAQMLLGQSYGWWVFGWVPRDIWPDKPAIDLGVYFKREIMGLATGGAFNVTGPGEAFINFGWAGLAVAPVLGWAFRLGEAYLLNARHIAQRGTAFLYPLLFYPFVQACLQSSFSAFIVGAGAQLMLIMVIGAVFLRPLRWRAVSSKRMSYA
ncbi:oligosaccharide repeat unit polymerase [Yoonia vestfoldensis]|uniref:Glyco_rpt_poly: oligosaccharide repeat unit polymerase n=1 Tax=Yoonia vestfoldensis TaxID=245188 RepID=A0A1Y0ED61_9RHOB|nr:oligosaccharide repeat unit polymerase [Yoonia vestfoldensis]ARU01555.1 glyco_rpt_poly: oligosaccharide repeat unit polymerase [Yoonia vestfoldensis]